MPLTCNINNRGRLARLIYGLALLCVGIVLTLVWAWGSGAVLPWFIAISCIVGGLFAAFEAWAGWCVMRAIGFKMPL